MGKSSDAGMPRIVSSGFQGICRNDHHTNSCLQTVPVLNSWIMILLADKEAEALHERSLTEAEEVCFLRHLVSVCCADVAY